MVLGVLIALPGFAVGGGGVVLGLFSAGLIALVWWHASQHRQKAAASETEHLGFGRFYREYWKEKAEERRANVFAALFAASAVAAAVETVRTQQDIHAIRGPLERG